MTNIWKKSLLVGVPEIDNQHKELIAAIENFREACKNSKGRDEITEIVKFLESYTIYHFQSEEELQKKYNYPDSRNHKILHTNFLNYVDSVSNNLQRYGYNLSLMMEFNRNLTNWLLDHINNEDQKVGKYIQNVTAVKI